MGSARVSASRWSEGRKYARAWAGRTALASWAVRPCSVERRAAHGGAMGTDHAEAPRHLPVREVGHAAVGDRLVVRGRRRGDPGRSAEILEVRGPGGTPPYRVRWGDGHVSLFIPDEHGSVLLDPADRSC